MKTLTNILVFKTNIYKKRDIKILSTILNSKLEILNWNIDLMDSDKVLRIESDRLSACSIVKLVINAGFECQELED